MAESPRLGYSLCRMRHAKHIGGVALLALAFLGLYATAGCAVGRRETDGAIVLGFEAGKLAETPGQIAAAATSFLPEPFGGLAQVALGALGVGGAVAASGRKRAQQESNEAYDEGRAAGLAEADRAKRAYDEARLREAYKRASPESFNPPPGAGSGGPIPVS